MPPIYSYKNQLQPVLIIILGILLLFELSKFRRSDVEQNRLPEGDELLPSRLVAFQSTCAEALQAASVRTFVIDNIFDGVSPFEGFPSSEVADLLDPKTRLKGWGSKSPVFGRLMKEVKPAVVIEVGTFLGASAVHMARLAKDLGLQTLILCVDDYRGWPGFREKFDFVKQRNGDAMLLQQFIHNVVETGFTNSILPIPFATSHALQYFCSVGITADLIEVDAGHDFHSAWTDINLAYKVLRPGGVMFGHDYFNKADKSGVQKAVLLFAKRNNLKVEADGAHWIMRGSDYVLPLNTNVTSRTPDEEAP
jgi:SAM-dependent methyltransferase